MDILYPWGYFRNRRGVSMGWMLVVLFKSCPKTERHPNKLRSGLDDVTLKFPKSLVGSGLQTHENRKTVKDLQILVDWVKNEK